MRGTSRGSLRRPSNTCLLNFCGSSTLQLCASFSFPVGGDGGDGDGAGGGGEGGCASGGLKGGGRKGGNGEGKGGEGDGGTPAVAVASRAFRRVAHCTLEDGIDGADCFRSNLEIEIARDPSVFVKVHLRPNLDPPSCRWCRVDILRARDGPRGRSRRPAARRPHYGHFDPFWAGNPFCAHVNRCFITRNASFRSPQPMNASEPAWAVRSRT